MERLCRLKQDRLCHLLHIKLDNMIKKSIYIILAVAALISCKKNEEDFTLESDLITNVFAFSDPSVPDLNNTWRGVYMMESTSNEILATGQKTNTTLTYENITDKEIGFAKKNMFHDFKGPDEITNWTIINNDEIQIESDAFFFDKSPTYFEVEIEKVAYKNGLAGALGALEIPFGVSVDLSNEIKLFFNLFPEGKMERLTLTMDYNFLSTDGLERSRVYREYHMVRASAEGLGIASFTKDKYE